MAKKATVLAGVWFAAAMSASAFAAGPADFAAGTSAGPSFGFNTELSLTAPPAAAPSAMPVSRDTNVRIRAFGIWSKIDGEAKIGPSVGQIESDIDLKDTLGVDTDAFSGGAALGFDLGSERRWHIDLAFWGYHSYDGDAESTFAFRNKVFTGRIESELSLFETSLDFGYDFVKNEHFTLTGGLGVRLFTIGIDASASGGVSDGQTFDAASDSETLWAPLPVLSLGGRWDVTEQFWVKAQLAGIYAGSYGYFINPLVETGYDFNRNFGVFAGVRYTLLSTNYNNDEAEIGLFMVYGGVELRF